MKKSDIVRKAMTNAKAKGVTPSMPKLTAKQKKDLVSRVSKGPSPEAVKHAGSLGGIAYPRSKGRMAREAKAMHEIAKKRDPKNPFPKGA